MAASASIIGSIVQQSNSQLEYLISQTSPSLLRPLAFFVSWNGVLTLAYSGFPPALAALKQSVNDTVSGLPAEYSGSKWPKTSLGALHDKARLTPQQLETLNSICREESAKFSQEEEDQAVYVDQLTVVFYECRCLERRILEHVIPMRGGSNSSSNSRAVNEAAQGSGNGNRNGNGVGNGAGTAPSGSMPGSGGGGGPPDLRQPDAVEQARVAGVVAEADAPDYWFLASKDGSRESHYRGLALGVTLVHDLAPFRLPPGAAPGPYGSRLPELISAFRARVEAELPGLYRWFADTSLHSTVRSLMG
ncbi:hypothetical protein HYH02_006350 [Chlamydomonas schloesseri]|uniref:Uncharacterized protein n=1 Tax=Chlamydomonas schloesseri TaxID=2026947 RepID=A0A835WJI8_9CHLO|nr:hypothetical protein HYH02_006350 [Chlamydomonas schloesseri]|eukprot:KAG2448458.1 hypothetical protein HYH02_006350 [Chlamydomonas schloesseri]